MSGHVAVPLRETVRARPVDHDAHTTGRANARDAPVACGRLELGEYIEHVMRLLDHPGPAHVVALCQPRAPTICKPASCATALAMAAAGSGRSDRGYARRSATGIEEAVRDGCSRFASVRL
jgi:poly-beta-hydroxyalkanoate depolymerase